MVFNTHVDIEESGRELGVLVGVERTHHIG
jgi:hypothetical protein